MSKGDNKTRKGKIQSGTFGVRRPRKSHQVIIVSSKPKATKQLTEKPKANKGVAEKQAPKVKQAKKT